MGCSNSRDEKVQDPKQKDQQVAQQGNINNKQNKWEKKKGAYGEVRKAIHKASQILRAVKILNRDKAVKAEQDKLRHEVEILRQLDHPNIIAVYESYQEPRYFYIVTELCTGGELFDKIMEEKQFSEQKSADIFKQILQAVNYCHKNNILHRDLKPENILFESSKQGSLLKICDFGTSVYLEPGKSLKQKLGTPYYIAPEVVEEKNGYNEKCDIWACGVILYIMLCGHPPFNGITDQAIMDKVKEGKVSFDSPEWGNVSQEAKDFIRKMLEKNPSKRYSAEQALKDKWLENNITKKEYNIPLLKKALKNMRQFNPGVKIQEATYIFLVNYLASKEEKQELLKAFQSLDLDGDGKLSRDELIQGFKEVLQDKQQAEIEVNKIMQKVDKNNSNYIDYSEFLMATIGKENLLTEQRLQTAFKMFDTDGSGMISIDELKKVFGGAGNVSDQVWMELLQQIDNNNDGLISYKEFYDIMNQLVEKHAVNEDNNQEELDQNQISQYNKQQNQDEIKQNNNNSKDNSSSSSSSDEEGSSESGEEDSSDKDQQDEEEKQNKY
ncbi:Protein kinase-like domain [Pseudocohnilembus persalinus]|uniref:Calcium-dependent protein kinase 1 n=1 Tax=Pseudocohnilembus persalinus TaxID=266149 RepID=A0A0V0QRN8_PSEPJ|nr:Protein kinase-like domain [Pseudocohnilembus persalinus]|eukprot:KRX04829.1 Protein kinase-like domain [Pseudocohnilembus persalinus]